MNIPFFAKKILKKFSFLSRIHFTQIMILVYGTIALAMLLVAVLGWDTYLFIQSISPLEAVTISEPKKISLTSQDIDGAIRIIDQRQQQFDNLLKTTTASTTIAL